MSYSHTKRRKLIARLKKQEPKVGWQRAFRNHVDDLVRQREGPPLCTLEDAMLEGKEKET